MASLRCLSPAKLNLQLDILGKRDDGYHNINSLVCLTDWFDELSIKLSDTLELQVTGREEEHLNNQHNLILQAARLLQTETSTTVKGAFIQLEKNIPPGAGLGGGSSNAAITLMALNRLWGLHLSLRQLVKLGEKLGADVALFFYGGIVRIEGIGEKISLPDIAPEQIPVAAVVVVPEIHCDTASVYNAFSADNLAQTQKRGKQFEAIAQKECTTQLTTKKGGVPFHALSQQRNQLSGAILQTYPELVSVVEALPGDVEWQFSGSGSSLFCCFPAFEDAAQLAQSMPGHIGGVACLVRAVQCLSDSNAQQFIGV